MKKLFWVCLIMLLAACAACAEEAAYDIPAGAVITDTQEAGPYKLVDIEFESGETAVLVIDVQSGEEISLTTTQAAFVLTDTVQNREDAESAVISQYPDAIMLFGEDMEVGSKKLYMITGNIVGEITVHGNIIISRTLNYGDYIRDGRLTMDGALAAMHMHRPEAEFRAVELDEDDGVWCYEGEAFIDGVEYEFELNASTGKLLEWERD